MPNPPLHLQRSIAFSLTSGGYASAQAGEMIRPPLSGKNVIARIDGDAAGVFSIGGLAVWGLVYESDAGPRGGRVWESVESADGTGPIALAGGNAPGALLVTVACSVDPSATGTSYSASVSMVEAGTSGPVLFSIPVTANVALISEGISGVVQWEVGIFDPFGLPSSEWSGLLQVSANTFTPGPSGGFGSYTPVAFGNLGAITSDSENYYAAYTIPDAPWGVPLQIQTSAGALFKVNGPVYVDVETEQIAGPDPVILTQAQPGVSGVDFVLGTKVLA